MASDRTKYVSINLLPHHQEKLETLVDWSGTNRNNFFRAMIMALTRDDVEKLLRR